MAVVRHCCATGRFVLTGIDDVDRASTGRAYTGSATDVPDLLRGTTAAPALPLIRAEAASTRRHGTDNATRTAGAGMHVRGDIASDEQLLRDCHRKAAALETAAP
ncbi:hypothetical protein ACFU53_11725 [Streptomyces sp. NPDC057474]|uniref:hypothetical protein n=1 Tax=Streptomyces sp. NPDC057474 TaxID=3346144 RepID=UPI0036836400